MSSNDGSDNASEGSTLPVPIRLEGDDTVATDMRFFSTSRMAVATLTGALQLFNISEGASTSPLSVIAAHSSPVRALDVPSTGPPRIYSVSRDRSLAISDLASGKVTGRVAKAHAAHGNAVTCLGEGGNFFATADEDGEVCAWDYRLIPLDAPEKSKGKPDDAERKKKGMVHRYQAGEDYVSDMFWVESKKRLLVTNGDGTLFVIDPRSLKKPVESLQQPADLLSVATLRSSTKVLAGCQDGTVAIWSWGTWDDPSDRFVGHPDSVECLLALDDNEFVTGSGDGIIRRCGAFPNRLVGVIGAHEDGIPVEKLRLGFPNGEDGQRVLASATGHDGVVMFWDPEAASEDYDLGDAEDDDAEDTDEASVVGDEDQDGLGTDSESLSSEEDAKGKKGAVEPPKRKRPAGKWEVEDVGKDETKEVAKKSTKGPKVAQKEAESGEASSDEDSDDSDASGGGRRKAKKSKLPDGKKSFTSHKGKPAKGGSFYADL